MKQLLALNHEYIIKTEFLSDTLKNKNTGKNEPKPNEEISELELSEGWNDNYGELDNF